MPQEAFFLVIFNFSYVLINFTLIDLTQSFLKSIPPGRKMVRHNEMTQDNDKDFKANLREGFIQKKFLWVFRAPNEFFGLRASKLMVFGGHTSNNS